MEWNESWFAGCLLAIVGLVILSAWLFVRYLDKKYKRQADSSRMNEIGRDEISYCVLAKLFAVAAFISLFRLGSLHKMPDGQPIPIAKLPVGKWQVKDVMKSYVIMGRNNKEHVLVDNSALSLKFEVNTDYQHLETGEWIAFVPLSAEQQAQ